MRKKRLWTREGGEKTEKEGEKMEKASERSISVERKSR
jgi:hypothetical protein